MKINWGIWILAGTLVSPVAVNAAKEPSKGGGDTVLRVAIFPFETETKQDSPQLKDFVQRAFNEVMNKDSGTKTLTLGEKITEILTAEISGNPAAELVEREKINKAYDELALGKTGLVDDATAARIGHMVGAQVLVTGRAFPVDDELFIVAKVMGVETSRVFAAKTSGPLSGKLVPMVQELGGSVSKVLLKHDTELVGKELKEKDYEALLQSAVGDRKRPTISVYVKEHHVTSEAIDPAVDTELTYLLQKTGFHVIDEKNKPLADWAAAYLEDSSRKPPTSAGTDVVIVGEAFSEFAARRGELVSCKARVELRAIDLKTGEVLAIDRKTATAVDLAEHIAAKAALQKATQELSLTLIPEVARKWNKR